MSGTEVHEQMRAEWNERAREDAHYFVAFGRRDQDDEEFFSTAADLVRELESELKGLPPAARESRRALEIGCGPGRLLRPMSRHFGEIHGVDVSDEMIARAKSKLATFPNIHPHAVSGSDLALFQDGYFDFVYSYAVFQHIPSRDVVFSYLRETVRVLKPGGVAHLQINGLPKTSKTYTTWEGVRVSAQEVHDFAREQGIRLLSLTGIETQYMWTTFARPPLEARTPSDERCVIRAISNAFSSEQAVPASGRLACAALSVSNLPDSSDLNSLAALIDGVAGRISYVGPAGHNRLTQVNVFLPPKVRTGLLPVSLEWQGRRLCPDGFVRVIPPGPAVPRLTALSDAVNLLSAQRIESGLVKATIEEVDNIDTFRATVDELPVTGVETFRTDPLAERWEVNFQVPEQLASGGHVLDVWLGKRLLTRIGILLTLVFGSLIAAESPETQLRKALTAKTGSVTLPSGTIPISREILLPPDAHDLEIRGNATTLQATDAFRGRALLVLTGGANIRIHDLSLDGNRDNIGRIQPLPPPGIALSRTLPDNGILAEGIDGIELSAINASRIAGFAIVVSGGRKARIHNIEVGDCGGFGPSRRNNGTGGVAIEQGATNFEIARSRFGGIRGNGVTLRSVNHGVITGNEFAAIARDALYANDSADLAVSNNRAHQIGFPVEEVDARAACLRLEQIQNSRIEDNSCTETLLSAIVLSGFGNRVTGNHLTSLNIAHKETPGIFLEQGAKSNTIEHNEVSGPGMGSHCVGAAPGVDTASSHIANNECSDEASLARLNFPPLAALWPHATLH